MIKYNWGDKIMIKHLYEKPIIRVQRFGADEFKSVCDSQKSVFCNDAVNALKRKDASFKSSVKTVLDSGNGAKTKF